ncbi:MAG: LysR family transcriptional regulator [Oceanospirillum sp.]|nr:LysR family transcriptional regulator [Oceanospirillum sp.]
MQHEQIKLFIESVRLGSISAGGRTLGLSPAAASAAIKRLELSLGVRLLERSTRSLSLTFAGEEYLKLVTPALELLSEAKRRARDQQCKTQGDIRLSTPSDLGRNLIAHWLREFQQDYPDIRIDLSVSDVQINLIHNHTDLAIRYGQPADSSLISRRLSHNRRILCASPAYLAQYGEPENPEELRHHNCLSLNINGGFNSRWVLCHPTQGEITADVNGSLHSDDGSLIRLWALEGAGIALKSWLDVCQDIQRGSLCHVLPDWNSPDAPLHLLYPHKKFQPARVRLLIDFLIERFSHLAANNLP